MKELEEFEKRGRAFIEGLASVLDLVKYSKDLGGTREELEKEHNAKLAERKDVLDRLGKLISDSEARCTELRIELDEVQDKINAANQEKQAIESFIVQRKREIDDELGAHRKKAENDLEEHKKEAKTKRAKSQRDNDD